MPSIKQIFHIQASKSEVFRAISNVEGLSHWWTAQTTGDATVGGVLQFRFNSPGCDMKVLATEENDHITWQCVAGFADWIGTTITITLEDRDGRTMVRFEHSGWATDNDFFGACSFSWGRYLSSLRRYCETGIGEAFGSENYA